jgi:hypothetical protein
MATGVAGSTFADELNRLANSGTYPTPDEYQSEQGAANRYAETSGLGIIAALNIKADTNRQPNDYKMMNAICNELAGTTGLSAVVALRSIDL